MATTPSPGSPTHDAPRISKERFTQLLKSKGSPATPEASMVYDLLILGGVEPAFALAQYRVESQYGTAGFAAETGSWGNMLHDRNLTLLGSGTQTEVVDGRTYVYATYDTFADAIQDYIRYLDWYRDEYGLDTIYEATARWLGRAPGSVGHLNYVRTIVSDMIEYQYIEGTFYETGDKMINTNTYVDRLTGKLKAKLFVKTGTLLYRGTDGVELKKLSPGTGVAGLDLWFLGPVNDSWEWGSVIVGLSDGRREAVYIKTPVQANVKFI